jgi:hypothetical protein
MRNLNCSSMGVGAIVNLDESFCVLSKLMELCCNFEGKNWS